MDAGKCPHVESILNDSSQRTSVLAKHAAVARWSLHHLQQGIPPAKRIKLSPPTCGECDAALARPFACLHCEFIGCWKDAHVAEHMKDEDHALCTESKTGAVFCVECNDFIYNPDLDRARSGAVLEAMEQDTPFQSTKKSRDSYKSWAPSESDKTALDGAAAVPCQGRRGLLNLGQTCFLNSVVQALIHTPLVRSYFLSEGHKSAICKHKDCLCCAMDDVFAETFGAGPGPGAPAVLLAALWRSSTELAGYSQQDAHEAFVALRNGLHATARGSTQTSCNCVVHEAFGGTMQSTVVCGKCGNETRTGDPMLDVPLVVRGEETLAGCLRRFTSPVKLAKDYSCSKCKTSTEATQTLSVKKLAPVLTFHFKRFEYKNGNAAGPASKVDDAIRFPTTLSMKSYTTFGMQAEADGAASVATGPEEMYEYALFAVVCHEGAIDNGHYYTFARYQDEWWRYDDDKVTKAGLAQVLDSKAYMLFYCKTYLEYRPHATPSYVLAREHEARREEERQREKEAAHTKEVDDALLEIL